MKFEEILHEKVTIRRQPDHSHPASGRGAIQAAEGHQVVIGYRTRIGHNVRVYTTSTNTDQDFRERPLISHHGDVIIGDGVWIGANTVILPGVTIGNNVAVGANSLVNKNIPSNTVWGGVPARHIKDK